MHKRTETQWNVIQKSSGAIYYKTAAIKCNFVRLRETEIEMYWLIWWAG